MGKKILVTGGTGFLGTHIVKKLIEHGTKEKDIRVSNSKNYNLMDSDDRKRALVDVDTVIHAAGNVGGIGYNQEYGADLLYDNLKMGMELMHDALAAKIKKFVCLGTICSYPKFTPVPFNENDIWNGYPEETNAPYGLAKKMLMVQGLTYRQHHGFNAIYLIPVNLYGPGDHFEPEKSHVIPALIKKMYDARLKGEKKVTLWGTGNVTREFLYVEDAAEAVVMATEKYNKPDPVNIGTGIEIRVKDLANTIAKQVGYKGEIVWDTTKPDGQPRRCLDVSRAKKEFGFTAKTPFEVGLKKEIEDYASRYYNL